MQQRTALRMAIPLSCGPLSAAYGGLKDPVVPAVASVQPPAARQIYIIVQRGQTLERVTEKFHIEGRGRSPQQSESPIRAEAVLQIPDRRFRVSSSLRDDLALGN